MDEIYQYFLTVLDEYNANPDGVSKLKVILASDDLLSAGHCGHLPLTTKSLVTKETHYPNAKGVWTKK